MFSKRLFSFPVPALAFGVYVWSSLILFVVVQKHLQPIARKSNVIESDSHYQRQLLFKQEKFWELLFSANQVLLP